MTTYGDLQPGAQFVWESMVGLHTLTVVSVEQTGVKCGESGSGATPFLVLTVEGMPKPLKGIIRVAADNPVEVVK